MSVVLTGRGARAIRDTSVLETARLREVIASLPARDVETIINGLSKLAAACRAHGDRASEAAGYRVAAGH